MKIIDAKKIAIFEGSHICRYWDEEKGWSELSEKIGQLNASNN